MKLPNLLCISGHDPSGGAGLQADLETAAAHGCHGAGVITALTRQDTRNAYAVRPVDDEEFAAQLDILLADMGFAAIKIGLVGSPGQVRHIASIAQAYPQIPLVLDPVLKAGGGATLTADPVARALLELLFPLATIATPNAAEARQLCPNAADLDSCGQTLAGNTQWILITGADEAGPWVHNSLYHADHETMRYEWPRLPGHYHGSGCTLASALAAELALGRTVPEAVERAQAYTWQALKQGFTPGHGQSIPYRLHALRG